MPLVAAAAWALLGERPSARVAVAVPLVVGGAVLITLALTWQVLGWLLIALACRRR